MRLNKRKILGSLAIGAISGIVFGPAVGILFGGITYGLSHASEEEERYVRPRRSFAAGRAGGYRLSYAENKAIRQYDRARASTSQVLSSIRGAYGHTSTQLGRVDLRLNSSHPSSDERATKPETLEEVIRRLIQA